MKDLINDPEKYVDEVLLPDTHNEWEKDFDRRFDLDDYGDSHITQGKVKRFIADLLNTHSLALRKEWVGKVRSIEHGLTAGDHIDGFEIAIDEVLALIEPDSST